MNAVVLFIFAFVGVQGLDQTFLDELLAELMQVLENCLVQENATSADLIDLIEERYPPSSHATKCLIACFYDHYKAMKPDGTFDFEGTIQIIAKFKDQDAELYGKMRKAMTICHENPEIFDDRCETASAMATCIINEGKKLGVTKESFMAA